MKKYQAPPCPDGLYEFVADCEGVELVCHLEHMTTETSGSMSLIYDPTFQGALNLMSAYCEGIDIAHLLLQYLVNDIEEAALTHLEFEKCK